MRLTNTIRDAFVRAAMADVPKIDYSEKIAKIVQADAKSKLPPKIRELADDKELRSFIKGHSHHISGWIISNVWVLGSEYQRSPKVHTQVEEMRELASEQSENMSALEAKVKAAAYAVTTRKALVEMLPEFEKYLPEDEAKASRSLPAIANIIDDFTKAGWPKTQSKGNTK